MAPSRHWTLLRCGRRQLLPYRVVFEGHFDLSLAAEAYGLQQHTEALRFVELRRLACSQEDPGQWSLRLIEAMLRLEQGDSDEAWHHLQLALAWRNQREQEAVLLDTLPSMTAAEWLAMATIALSVDKLETAESYASEAVSRVQKSPTCCVSDLLRDTRADAMTVFATVRLAQQRYSEAELLLQLAYDAHVQAGDIEQMIVDSILLADVEFHSGDLTEASYLLCDAELLLEECDSSRHHRCDMLKDVIHQRLLDGHRRRSTASPCFN